jgi:hypothetical protein
MARKKKKQKIDKKKQNIENMVPSIPTVVITKHTQNLLQVHNSLKNTAMALVDYIFKMYGYVVVM